ncbi:DUF1684 domain-containing protein [Agrococcus sp. ARC_14]|uniref:DUF1684 domain-containing protein n=1 Tax=Agrococcus sp. ARC_14 TaxID=2919927 RepID=UPI001F06648D|nr:DUF1684 domain-containing protein [Agrococcus sp. ARC_14]MCH1883521.1 DUF1684 domain-containing protein [Agrococcus sp. ARC_14]
MTSTRVQTDAFARDWQAWHARRWNDVAAPHGIAALAATHWLSAVPRQLEGVPGSWHAEGAATVGTGLADSGLARLDGRPVEDAVLLIEGDELRDGETVLRAFAREGVPALRVIDPAAERRRNLEGILAFDPDPAWVVPARWTAGGPPLDVEQVDGHRTRRSDVGSLAFELDGRQLRLTTTGGVDADGDPALAVVFGDTTNGDTTYRFRFLRLPLPDASGTTTIDFNRAFLPPCAFSDHYVCPMPSPANRLDLAVPVGERRPVSGEPHGSARVG